MTPRTTSRQFLRPVVIALMAVLLAATACGSSDNDLALSESAADESESIGGASSGGDSDARLDGPAPVPARPADESDDSDGAAAESAEAEGKAASDDEPASEPEPEPASDEDSSDGAAGALDVAGEAVAELEADSAAEAGDGEELTLSDREPEESPPLSQPRPQAGTLTAAEVDDNLNFDFFNGYLSRIQQDFGGTLPSAALFDRIVVDVVAPNGVGIGNARIDVDGAASRAVVYTNSAGRAYLYPTWLGLGDASELTLTTTDSLGSVVDERNIQLSAEGGDVIRLEAEAGDTTPPSALDIALVLDTTGSMADELAYLTVEFEAIINDLKADYGNVDMRFALITYRDQGDDYVTQVYDFTSDVGDMSAQLSDQRANGGGDYPEAMDAALDDAGQLSWRDGDVARVLILNADAPPHDNDAADTLDAARSLGQAGVRIYPLAASGVGDSAEYLMRIMGATTGGRHMFLTDDSGVGGSHQEPKTQCYVVTHLDDLIRRVLAGELAGERIEAHPDSILRTVGQYDRGTCA